MKRIRESGRSYDIATPAGVFPRNRRFLRLAREKVDLVDNEPVPEVCEEIPDPVPPRRSARLRDRRVRFDNNILLLK